MTIPVTTPIPISPNNLKGVRESIEAARQVINHPAFEQQGVRKTLEEFVHNVSKTKNLPHLRLAAEKADQLQPTLQHSEKVISLLYQAHEEMKKAPLHIWSSSLAHAEKAAMILSDANQLGIFSRERQLKEAMGQDQATVFVGYCSARNLLAFLNGLKKDPVLSKFFKNADVERLKPKLRDYMTQAQPLVDTFNEFLETRIAVSEMFPKLEYPHDLVGLKLKKFMGNGEDLILGGLVDARPVVDVVRAAVEAGTELLTPKTEKR